MQVYFANQFAGQLNAIGNGYTSFVYDKAYLQSPAPALSLTLPKQPAPFIAQGLLPYFDNLVAEGWLQNLQAAQLGVSPEDRLTLLAHFGHDLIGCVTLQSDSPLSYQQKAAATPDVVLAMATKFSLSGVQPKLLAVKENKIYRAAHPFETSTHIAKLPSPQYPDLIANEYITTCIYNQFVEKRYQAEVQLAVLPELAKQCLMVKRFDRKPGQKIHMEEANQCLNRLSHEKYQGCCYADLSVIMNNATQFIPAERLAFFHRVCLFILLGNTDAHFKNFAFLHQDNRYWLAPGYDIVATALYPPFQTFAMPLAKGMNAKPIKQIQASQVLAFAKQLGLSQAAIASVYQHMAKRLPTAMSKLEALNVDPKLQQQLLQFMEKRWNNLFTQIGKQLSPLL